MGAHAYLLLFRGKDFYSLFLSHPHTQQQQLMEGPPIDYTPRVPRDITKARIDNFMLKGSIFYEMGIHYGLWTHRHHGPPHVTLSVYSVPDLKVNHHYLLDSQSNIYDLYSVFLSRYTRGWRIYVFTDLFLNCNRMP